MPEKMSSKKKKEDKNGVRYFYTKFLPFRTKLFMKIQKLVDRA